MQYELSQHGKSRILANATPGGTGSNSSAIDHRSNHRYAQPSSTAVALGSDITGISAAGAGAQALGTVPAAMYSASEKRGIKGEVTTGHLHLDAGNSLPPAAASSMPSNSRGQADNDMETSVAKASHSSVAYSVSTPGKMRHLGMQFFFHVHMHT